MLKPETIKSIATLIKIKPADLEAAIKDEKEIDVTIDEKLSVFSEDELTQLKANEYKNGKSSGVEMAVKDAKEKLGLEFTGKTIDGLIDAATKKAMEDAKIEPTKQVQELTEKLKTVQSTAQELQTKLQEKEGEVSSIKAESAVIKDIPTNTTLPAQKVLGLMKMDGYEYKVNDGKIVWYKDGQLLNDKLGNSFDTKTIVGEYVTENKLSAGSGDEGMGGRGGGDGKPPASFTALSQIKKVFTESGKNLQGQEFADAVKKAVSENPDFKMDA
jgi:uncharacterized coiled-coil protein SlyX